MSQFSRRESQPLTSNKRKRRPEGVSRRRNKNLGFEPLEDRRVMSANPLVQLRGPVASGVNITSQSYSSNTLEGQLAILQNELYWASLPQSSASSDQRTPMAIPTDPLLNQQWHLINSGQQVGGPDFQQIFAIPGEDINVGSVWNQGIFGNGVVVGVLEPGFLQTDHPDLAANIDPLLVFPGSGFADEADNAHATAVAGLIGAVANNGIGGTGVAPGTTLIPMQLPNALSAHTAFRYAIDNNIDIVNNSWGFESPDGEGRQLFGMTFEETLAFQDAAKFGRNGLGTIFVFATGNSAGADFDEGFPTPFAPDGIWDTAAYEGYLNSRYVIGVTGVDHDGFYNNADGTFTSYAEMSTATLVAAPTGSVFYNIGDDIGLGSGIVTTDLTGENGVNRDGVSTEVVPGEIFERDFLQETDYTSRFNGTSASAPLVSGVIALMLEANPNLTWRDVQEILVRSARQNAEFEIPSTAAQGSTQNTWIQNQMPVFHDPDVYDPAEDPFDQTLNPTLDPTLGTIIGTPIGGGLIINGANSNHYAPTPITLTNGAGYTVSQGVSPYAENIGYAHGVVDAELAVALAQQWHTKGQNLPNELTFTSSIFLTEGPDLNIPGAEKGSQDSGFQLVPGGIGGTVGGGFIDYWNEYFVDDPFVDFDDDDVRGGFLEFSVPDSSSMVVDNIELKLSISGAGADFLDHARVLLVSPNGTHSELNQFWVEPNTPFSLQNQSVATISGEPGSTFDGAGNLVWTFRTNRSWGERSDDALIFDPRTGEPVAQQGWRLFIENYDTGSAFGIAGLEMIWHGSPIAANTQRIQGVVGVDSNQDNAFNFSRIIRADGDINNDGAITRYGEVVNLVDLTHESMGANVTVVARRASDGVIVDRFVTGADGNYYFDLVPDDYIISVEDPEGRVALEDTLSPADVLQNYRTQWTISEEFFQVWDYDQNLRPGVDANGVPISLGLGTYHVKDINFLLDPGPPVAQQVQFNGSVLADFNGDSVLNGNDVAVPNARVYADINRNGQLDPGEASVLTNANGQYNLVVPTATTTVINVGVIAPPTWTFSDPALGFEPLFVEPGDIFNGVNLRLTPPLGTSGGDGSSAPGYIMGVVYEDANNNSTRQATESGVSGIQVYIDQNNNGTREVNEPLTTTNANGAYIFGNVAPGTHRVRAIPVAPLTSINPGPGVPKVVNLAGGGTTSQIEFGIGLGNNPSAVFDYGDLPTQYGITLQSENGARHQRGAYYLGTRIDVENNGQPSANADGDDLIGNDEDGIVVTPLISGSTGTLVATASRQGGVLQGWVDFNGDFDFNDPGERILTNVGLVAGANTITFQIPTALAGASSATGGVIYARFRYGEYGINSLTGTALLGEVEDYILARDPSSLPAVIEHGPDFDEDGDVDGRDFMILQRNWGRTNALGTQGDATGDGIVGYNDMVMWKNYYGTTAGGYAAFTAGDEEESLATVVATEEPLEDQVAVVLDGVVDQPEEAPLVEAILIVDTVGPAEAIEVSAQASTSVVPGQVDTASVAAAFKLLSGDGDVDAEEDAVVLEADDLDAVFGSSSDLADLGLALKKNESGAYRYDDEDLASESEEGNVFELAFADEADWRQF